MEESRSLTCRQRTLSGWAAVVMAVFLVCGSRSVGAETIRISGTGGALETMRILGEAFRKNNPGTRVEIMPGMGSSGSVKAVLAGRLEIGLTGRPLNDGERDRGVVETRYAKTPFVFAVNKTLKITGMTMEGVSAIYAGKRDWENGKRIRLVLRAPQDSDVPVLKGMSPAMNAAVDVALRRKGMIIASTDDDAADIIESVPGAFGGTTLSLVLSEKRPIRVLALDGVEPSVRTMADRSYRHSKTFFMVTRKNPSVAVRRFIAFVRSPAGSAILSKYGQSPVRQEGSLP